MLYKLEIQQGLYKSDYTGNILTMTNIIEADRYEFEQDTVYVTKENIHIAEFYYKNKYKIGDSWKGPRKSISFYKNDIVVHNEYILGDPYFKLYDENDNLLEQHCHTC